jgi:hypothetical protein
MHDSGGGHTSGSDTSFHSGHITHSVNNAACLGLHHAIQNPDDPAALWYPDARDRGRGSRAIAITVVAVNILTAIIVAIVLSVI